MLNLIIGTVGGGKSYEAVVYHVLPALQEGRMVITNLPLNIEEFRGIEPSYAHLIELRHPNSQNPLPFSRLEDYQSSWRHPVSGTGALYVIDECHIPLPFKATSKAIEDWFSLHRHSSSDVVLITQNYQKVSKSIRDLAQNLYRVRKNIAFGSSKTYTRGVYDGLGGALIERSQRIYKSQYFKLYQSHTLGGGKELNRIAFKTFWHHWIFKALILMFFLGIYTFSKVDWSRSPFNSASYGKAPASAVPVPVGTDITPLVRQSPEKLSSLNLASADYSGTGDYPFKGARFVIRGAVKARHKTSYLIEVLNWGDDKPSLASNLSSFLGDSKADKSKDSQSQVVSSILTPVAKKRNFITLDTLLYAGYSVQPFDECNIKLSYTVNAHTDVNLISCSYPQ